MMDLFLEVFQLENLGKTNPAWRHQSQHYFPLLPVEVDRAQTYWARAELEPVQDNLGLAQAKSIEPELWLY